MTTPLDAYKQYFPHFTPSIFQQELIEAYITNMEVWHEVLTMWASNDYRAASIGKMITMYDEKIEALSPSSYNHVRNQPTQRETIEAEQRAIAQMKYDSAK